MGLLEREGDCAEEGRVGGFLVVLEGGKGGVGCGVGRRGRLHGPQIEGECAVSAVSEEVLTRPS